MVPCQALPDTWRQGCTAHTQTARIVKPVRTAATDLNVKHRTPQEGRWAALRAVSSTVRRNLSPVGHKNASQPARPGAWWGGRSLRLTEYSISICEATGIMRTYLAYL